MGRRALLLLCVVVVLRADDGCWPGDYVYNRGQVFDAATLVPVADQPLSYCGGLSAGGGGSCNGLEGWTWTNPGVTCSATDQVPWVNCPCNSYYCSNKANCHCSSSKANGVDKCYTAMRTCAACTATAAASGRAQQRIGCGCVDCSTTSSALLAFYARNAYYNFPAHQVCADLRNFYACCPGACEDCPKGAYCPDNLRALPCPPGFYQDEIGQTSCKECVLPFAKDSYVAECVDPRSLCDPIHGWLNSTGKAVRFCDDCTQFNASCPEIPMPSGARSRICAQPNAQFGVFSDQTCRPCVACAGRQYARPSASQDRCCVTDQSVARCEEMYNDNVDIAGYACSSPSGDVFDGRRTCKQANEVVARGAMPWRAGFRRTLSEWRYIPGCDQQRVADPGLLPHYVACADAGVPLPATNPLQGALYVQTHYSKAYAPRQQQVVVDSWDDDCSLDLTRECAPGYYAVLSADDPRLLMQCLPCAAAGGGGGLNQTCNCPVGTASWSALVRLLPAVAIENDDVRAAALLPAAGGGAELDPQACIPCIEGQLRWKHANSSAYVEAVACPGSLNQSLSAVRCAGSSEYVSPQAPGRCSYCNGRGVDYNNLCPLGFTQDDEASAALWIPTPNRTACAPCAPGTYVAIRSGTVAKQNAVYQCAPCPDGTFQPAAGQCGCRLRRAACPPGARVAQTSSVTKDPTRDYECVACDAGCPEGQITIAAPNAGNDTCDGLGHSYFACYDDDEGDGSGPALAPGFRLQYALLLPPPAVAGGHVTLERCGVLPPYAVYVTHSIATAVGAQCYFACQHGVNASAAAIYQRLLAGYVHASRRDLIPFLPSFGSGGSTHKKSAEEVNAPAAGAGGETWTTTIALAVEATGVADPWQNTFLYDETVLYTLLPPGSSLCLSPAEAYTLPCPSGFAPQQRFTDKYYATHYACALQARTALVRVTPAPPYDRLPYAVVVSDDQTPLCMTTDDALSRFQIGCTTACLDQRLLLAYQAQRVQLPPTMDANAVWYDRLAWIAFFLQASFWSGGSNPYLPLQAQDTLINNSYYYAETAAPFVLNGFAGSGNCSTRCAYTPGASALAQATGQTGPRNTFRYSTIAHANDGSPPYLGKPLPPDGLSACVPCDAGYGSAVCHGLFQPPRFFRIDLCVNPPSSLTRGAAELDTGLVCDTCATTLNSAVLILATDSRYEDWWNVRANTAPFSYALVNGLNQWQNLACRYYCALGYTSNNANAAAYGKAPCVACVAASSQTLLLCQLLDLRTVPAYIDGGQNGGCGQAAQNYAPYQPSCQPCASAYTQTVPDSAYLPRYKFFVAAAAAANPAPAASQCLALCNPSVYLSYDLQSPADNSAPIQEPVPVGRLRCVPCADGGGAFSCQGRCLDGFFHNASAAAGTTDCVRCTTAPCATAGFYREGCLAGLNVMDARCLACPSLLLTATTRRWVSVDDVAAAPAGVMVVTPVPRSPHPQACMLACANNHAWLNLSSGLAPSAAWAYPLQPDLPQQLECVPCASISRQRLFAVWNDTNISAVADDHNKEEQVLDSMLQFSRYGGCRPCPGFGMRTVTATSRRMCELLPGFTNTDQMIDPTDNSGLVVLATTLVVPTATATVQLAGDQARAPPTLREPPAGFGGGGIDRRRRVLLQLQAQPAAAAELGQFQYTEAQSQPHQQTTTQVRQSGYMARPPVLRGADYYACCDDNSNNDGSSSSYEMCVTQRSRSFQGANALTGARMRACQPSQQTQQRRRLLQQEGYYYRTSEFGSAVEAWFVNATGIAPSQACLGGTFKPNAGDGPCFYCPIGGSTTAPAYVAASAVDHCACLPGYYSVRNANNELQACVPCANGTYRSPYQDDGQCVACPAGMGTGGLAGAMYCFCPQGTYPNLQSTACVPCEAGFFCDGNARARCPEHSVSRVGAGARTQCACNPTPTGGDSGFYGDLSLPDGVCLPRPPGAKCANSSGAGAVACGCAPGWTVKTVRQTSLSTQPYILCVSPCGAGQYAEMSLSSQSFMGCAWCPPDTYAPAGAMLIDACTPCPVGRGTQGRTGRAAADECRCLAGAASNSTSTTCAGCAAGEYLDLLAHECARCPPSWTSSPGAVGRLSCECPPGQYAAGAALCAPCPKGSYSHTLGLTCTACPRGCTTDQPGQTSIVSCRCSGVHKS